jgi:hypothetical protein
LVSGRLESESDRPGNVNVTLCKGDDPLSHAADKRMGIPGATMRTHCNQLSPAASRLLQDDRPGISPTQDRALFTASTTEVLQLPREPRGRLLFALLMVQSRCAFHSGSGIA